jgi:hypothetical protein
MENPPDIVYIPSKDRVTGKFFLENNPLASSMGILMPVIPFERGTITSQRYQ